MDSTSGIAWDELNAPEITAGIANAVLRVEKVIATFVETRGPHRYPPKNVLELLRGDVEMLEESPFVTDELRDRMNAALKLLRSTFGLAPHEVMEMQRNWEEQTLEFTAHLEQLHKDCDELCMRMKADQSDAGADEMILQMLRKDHACFDLNTWDIRARLAINATAGDMAGSRKFAEVSQAVRNLSHGADVSTQRLTLHRNFKVKKPLLYDGEIVYAYSASDAKMADGEPWRTATIISHRELGPGHGYGPCRMYTVHFHHKREPEEINDYKVNTWGSDEYARAKDVGTSNSGCIKRGFDENSEDLWAKEIGWFVALPGKEELHFPLFSDALTAYDTRVIEVCGLDGGFEKGLIFDYRWNEYQERASNKKSASVQAKLRCHLRLRVLLVKDLLPEGDMNLIGGVLAEMTEPDQPLMDPNGADVLEDCIGHVWRMARRCFFNGCEQSMRKSVFHHALLKTVANTAQQGAEFDCLLMKYIDAAGDIDRFSTDMPITGWMHTPCSSPSLNEMMEYLDDNVPEASHLLIHAVHPNGITSEWNVMGGSRSVQEYLKAHAKRNNTTVKSLRLKYNDRTIFMSSIRDKSPEELGMADGILEVSFIQSTSEEERSSKPKSPPSNSKKSKGKKKKKHRKSNKKRSTQPASFENEGDKLKEKHSQSLSRVFEEADATFRSIRQKLEAMNLERTLPKEKRSRSKPKVVPAEPLDNPSSDCLAGKAGKTHFIVQVGETNNLYNTRGSKQSAKQSAGRISREVDLHGCTQEEALSKLEECLPEWVDTAMKGEYPWVITAKIVCGGGSQVLSESVEGWIKRNPNVSNAPKNLYA